MAPQDHPSGSDRLTPAEAYRVLAERARAGLEQLDQVEALGIDCHETRAKYVNGIRQIKVTRAETRRMERRRLTPMITRRIRQRRRGAGRPAHRRTACTRAGPSDDPAEPEPASKPAVRSPYTFGIDGYREAVAS